jgi:MFS family permease
VVAQYSHLLRIVLIALPLILFSTFGFHPIFAFLLALNNGLGWNVYYPASKALIQRIAGGGGVVAVNSGAEVTMQVGLFSAGAVSGLLYKLAGFEIILILAIAAFAIGMLILTRVRLDEAPPDPQVREPFAVVFRSGFRYLRHNRLIVWFAIVLYAPFIAANIFGAVLPGYVDVELHADSVGYGVIDMFWGVGACLAGLLVLKVAGRLGLQNVVTGAFVVLVLYGALMVFPHGVTTAVVLTGLAGLGAASVRILLYSYLMDIVSPAYMGRVIAIVNVLSLVLQTVLTQVAGWIMDTSAPRYGFTLFLAVSAVALGGFTIARRSARSTPPDPATDSHAAARPAAVLEES